jgi:CarD family transcriptional regulator
VHNLFQVGDKVFYPMHGAGTVKAIEEKDVLGAVKQYCVISIPISQMDIMIPMDKLEKSGVRSIVGQEIMKEVLQDFHHAQPHEPLAWKERFSANQAKIKTGDIRDSAEVVHDLLLQNKEKALNSSEKQMLHQAQRYLISEIVLISGMSENEAADLIKC